MKTGETTRVFVYGTLLRGQSNHRVLRGGLFVREARTRAEHTMFDLGAFPGVARGGATAIVGEIFDVDAGVLERLDMLEGHPRFYERQAIELEDGERVSAYLLPLERYAEAPLIVSGSWRAYQAGSDEERDEDEDRVE